jgi:hypothetical protein
METVETTDFHPVVKLLISRMESNPEEFDGRGLWRSRVDIYDDAYTPEETAALAAAERHIRLDRKHAKVMKALLSPPGEDEERARLEAQAEITNQWGQLRNAALSPYDVVHKEFYKRTFDQAQAHKAYSTAQTTQTPKGLGNALKGIFK